MANSTTSNRVYYEELRFLGFDALGAGYVAVGSMFAHPVYQLKITNLTNANLIISYDGIKAVDVIQRMGVKSASKNIEDKNNLK